MSSEKGELPTALLSRKALRDLLDASLPEDASPPEIPFGWIATGVIVVLAAMFIVIVTRFH
jgi:hypothetical protein